jgi:hypothetical protein
MHLYTTDMDDKLFDLYVQNTFNGKIRFLPLTEIVDALGITMRVFFTWLDRYPSFKDAYDKAKRARSVVMVEQTLDIADETESAQDPVEITSAKLRVDVRRWIAQKHNAPEYSDRMKVDSNVTYDGLTDEEIDARLTALRKKVSSETFEKSGE